MPKYSEVCDEYRKIILVQEYFMEKFLYLLLTVSNASKDLIKNYRLENYKTFVDKYNSELEQQLLNGSLITPAEIVNSDSLNLNGNKKM